MAGDGLASPGQLLQRRGAGGSSSKAEPFFHQGAWLGDHVVGVTRFVVRVRGKVVWLGFPFPFLGHSWFLPVFAQSTHAGGTLTVMSASPFTKDEFRDRRSVQALVSLCEVTPDKAARRQRPQASSAFGMCVRSGTRSGEDLVQARSVGNGGVVP